jgi:hypothetical protein
MLESLKHDRKVASPCLKLFHAISYAPLQSCPGAVNSHSQSIQLDAQLSGHLLSDIYFYSPFLTVVLQYKAAALEIKMLHALFQALELALFILGLGQRLDALRLSFEIFFVYVLGDAVKVERGVSGVVFGDLPGFATDAVHGLVGQFFGDHTLAADEYPNKLAAYLFILLPGALTVSIQPGEEPIKVLSVQ